MPTEVVSADAAPRISEATVRELRSFLRGELILPGEAGYDAVRATWNGAVNRSPALVVRAVGPSDVLAAIDFAGTHELPFSVRGTGHNVSGSAIVEGGLVLDTSRLTGIGISPSKRVARAGAGLTLDELNREAQTFGLAIPGGKNATPGIAGVTLGGGAGWLLRKFGLAIDNVLSYDLVTADGRLLTASADEHPDLFWALRGGGGNFGVVTAIEYRLHPVGVVLGGAVVHPLPAAKEALRFYREYAAGAPDELTMVALLLVGPDGRPAVGIMATYAGAIPDGEKVLQPLRAYGSPVVDTIAPIPYDTVPRITDTVVVNNIGRRWESGFVTELPDGLVDALVDGFGGVPTPESVVLVEQFGGAFGRVEPTATAFAHRDAAFNVALDAGWRDAATGEAANAWADRMWQAIRPYTRGVYVNYLGPVDDERIKEAYGPMNHARLRALKHRYDPTNFFRSNQNIRPASS